MLNSEIEKLKYHDKFLLIIATAKDDERENLVFFQNIIAYDLSEPQVRVILKSVLNKDMNRLVQYLEDQDINYAINDILKDLIRQDMLVEQSKCLLEQL